MLSTSYLAKLWQVVLNDSVIELDSASCEVTVNLTAWKIHERSFM